MFLIFLTLASSFIYKYELLKYEKKYPEVSECPNYDPSKIKDLETSAYNMFV